MDRNPNVDNFFGHLKNGHIHYFGMMNLKTNLMYAYAKNQEEIDLLNQNGFDINKKNPAGKNALFYSRGDNFNLLIKNGADFKNITNKGKTILWYAESHNIDFLVENGVDINHLNERNENAIFSSKTNQSKKLIELGINIHQMNDKGENALFYSRNEKTLLLINHGIDYLCENMFGVFAFNKCVKERIIDLLLKKGVDYNIRNKNNEPAFFKMITSISYLNRKNAIDIHLEGPKGNALFYAGDNDKVKRYLIEKNISVKSYFFSNIERKENLKKYLEKKYLEEIKNEKKILSNIINPGISKNNNIKRI